MTTEPEPDPVKQASNTPALRQLLERACTERGDLVQLTGPLRRARDNPNFAAALRQRLDGIRNGDAQATWRAL
jgi:hypothetical protein